MLQDEYYIVFDTNILHVSHDKRGDFTAFSFNSEFNKVVGCIESLDMYTHIKILVPDVVYEEMKKQKIFAYTEKREQLLRLIKASTFPNFEHESEDIDYDAYIADKIAEYQAELAQGQVDVAQLPLPSEKRFANIITRAFDKRAPFSGEKKGSDKGFKDTLLWESILEFKEAALQSRIILYSRDIAFSNELTSEFHALYQDEIFIVSKYEDLESQIKVWAKSIDPYLHIPDSNFSEYDPLGPDKEFESKVYFDSLSDEDKINMTKDVADESFDKADIPIEDALRQLEEAHLNKKRRSGDND